MRANKGDIKLPLLSNLVNGNDIEGVCNGTAPWLVPARTTQRLQPRWVKGFQSPLAAPTGRQIKFQIKSIAPRSGSPLYCISR